MSKKKKAAIGGLVIAVLYAVIEYGPVLLA